MESVIVRKGDTGFRLALFIIFFACGILVFPLAANYYSLLPTNDSTLYKAAVPVLFLGVSLLLRRSQRLHDYWRIAYAFFVASAANLLVWLGGTWLFRLVNAPADPLAEMAVNKLSEATVVIAVILLLTRLAGWKLGDLYIRRGNSRLGLVLALGFSIPVVVMFVAMGGLSLGWEIVLAAAPAILVYSLLNGFMEELWFRGIFLREYKRLLGGGTAILLTALLFTIMHFGMTYASGAERIQLLGGILYLGLATAYIILKTESLWGAVLLHAVADAVLLLGFFAAP
ncbi:MAG: CPBP family intramembrane glutamic endopeptidase [Chloroflexota bacterium]|nr:CPBP family intramembrane glutamic endopeptidase [Chloroflexota bacterium]